MTDFTRSAGLTGFVQLAASFGLNPVRLARSARLPAAALTEPDLPVPAGRIATLLNLAAEQSGVEDFGLRLADKRRMSTVGPLALLASMQPTLREMLKVLCNNIRLHSESLVAVTEETDRLMFLRVEFVLKEHVPLRQSVDMVLGSVCRYIQAVMETGWCPKAVMLRSPPPRGPTLHAELFRRAPTFSADFDGLVIDRRDLDREFNAPDPVLISYLQAYIDQMYSRTHATTADEVRQVLMGLLPGGRSQADAVAASMGINRRTLARRLAEEKTTFSQLLEDVRAKLIETHLAAKRPYGEVAELVGLASSSGLAHWLTRHGKRDAAVKQDKKSSVRRFRP